MKISPIAAGGNPGQNIGSVEVSSPQPLRLERARAIARGEMVPKQTEAEPAARAQQNTRSLKMRTNFSTNREELPLEQAEEPPVEPVSTTAEIDETGAVEATQPLSPQFAALAKQKRALQLERADLERQKAEFTGKQNGLSTEQISIADLKANPLSVLQQHGVLDGPEFYNSITEKMLNGDTFNPEILELKQKIEALEKGVDTKFQTAQERSEKAALTEMHHEALALSREGDEFEMIRSKGPDAVEKVLDHIYGEYHAGRAIPDVKVAMEKIENELLEDAAKIAALSKVRNRLAPPPTQTQQPQQQTMRTLTARDTASPTTSRRARAIAAMQGTLRK